MGRCRRKEVSLLFSRALGRGHFHADENLGRESRLSVPQGAPPLVVGWATCLLLGQRPWKRLRRCCTVNGEQKRKRVKKTREEDFGEAMHILTLLVLLR
jgi:hypothetical protein